MSQIFQCPYCQTKLHGKADGQTRLCPNCKKTVVFRDLLHEIVPIDDEPSTPFPVDPIHILIGSGVLEVISLIAASSGSTVIAAILGALAIGGLILAVILLHSERTKNLKNHGLAESHFKSLNQSQDLVKSLRDNFDNLVAARKSELDNSHSQRNQQLETEFQIAWNRIEHTKSTLDERELTVALIEDEISGTVDRLGKRLLNDSVRFISSKLTANNFTSSRDRLVKVIEFCRKHGFAVAKHEEQQFVEDLRAQFELAVRRQYEREEQARIKSLIREEQRAQAEYEREIRRADDQREAIQRALDQALTRTQDEHSAEVEELRRRLAEAEEKAERAKSMAQQTKAGYVYVISNIGSFGEHVFKVGMTRRLEPLDRVKELSGAAVPFPFDIHMMISCNNAPQLEHTIHKALAPDRVNKVNLRKEYFRTDIETIRELVEANHGIVEYVADPEALQYFESLDMDEDEQQLIERAMIDAERSMGAK